MDLDPLATGPGGSENENDDGTDISQKRLVPFVCGFCCVGKEAPANASYFSASMLLNHLRICHQQGLKPYKCKLCPDYRCSVKEVARAHGVINHNGTVSFTIDNSKTAKYRRKMTLMMAYSSVGMREESKSSERFRKLLLSCLMPAQLVPIVDSKPSNDTRVG